MSRPLSSGGRRAFTLVELLVVLTIIALLVGILLPALGQARRASRASLCRTNLKQFGVAFANYASDYSDRIASFTWKPGVTHSVSEIYPGSGDTYTFPAAGNYNQAASDQAVAILRFRAERTDITQITGWIPHVMYSHLVLNDYLQQRLPEKMVVCPADRHRLNWQEAGQSGPIDQGAAYFALTDRPNYPTADNANKRWPYSSSYQLVPCGYSPDKQINSVTGPIPTVAQSSDGHRFYTVGTSRTVLGHRRLSEITFPGSKVALFDPHQRHESRGDLFYAYAIATQPLLFFDTSVSERRTADSNLGFFPNTPASPLPTEINYQPDLNWESPRIEDGTRKWQTKGRYQWCREGLRGVDFGGGEVP